MSVQTVLTGETSEREQGLCAGSFLSLHQGSFQLNSICQLTCCVPTGCRAVGFVLSKNCGEALT